MAENKNPPTPQKPNNSKPSTEQFVEINRKSNGQTTILQTSPTPRPTQGGDKSKK